MLSHVTGLSGGFSCRGMSRMMQVLVIHVLLFGFFCFFFKTNSIILAMKMSFLVATETHSTFTVVLPVVNAAEHEEKVTFSPLRLDPLVWARLCFFVRRACRVRRGHRNVLRCDT